MFAILIMTTVIIFMWPRLAMRYSGHVICGLSVLAAIMLWAIILDPGPARKTPPIGITLAEASTHEWNSEK